jgi:hypothetical protein
MDVTENEKSKGNCPRSSHLYLVALPQENSHGGLRGVYEMREVGGSMIIYTSEVKYLLYLCETSVTLSP